VNVVPAALDDVPASAKFNINAWRPTNSLLVTVAEVAQRFRDLYETVDQVDVDVITIDEYCSEHAIGKVDILKLDLQGYDYKALLGARSTLRNVDVVLSEVWFTETYVGVKLFSDVLALMVNSGFRLHALCGMHYGERDELMWGDAIFTRIVQSPDSAAKPLEAAHQ
jgi:FkbM family methyltransferase